MCTLIDNFIGSYTDFIDMCDKIPEKYQSLYFQRLSCIIYQIRYLTNDINMCKTKFSQNPDDIENIDIEFYKISDEDIVNMLIGTNSFKENPQ